MALGWSGFAEEVARRKPVFWLRDDDAVTVTPALERLLSLSRGIPIALAVIPELAEPSLFAKDVAVLQHGCDHRNRAAPGEKKTEFPASESIPQALQRLRLARERLVSMAGSRVLPVIAPPWNRLRRELAAELPRIGIRGLSCYGKEAGEEQPIPGVLQINTQVDIVDWREGKRFVGEDEAARLAMNNVLESKPVGWLTHHAVHDEAAWAFLERLFALPGPRWTGAAELFSYNRPAHG
jgi:hypothetical protein